MVLGKRAIGLGVSWCLFVGLVGAQTPGDKRPITVQDLWQLHRLGAPQISPDGTWCVVDVTRWDVAADESFSELWFLSTDGKVQRQLTHSGGKNSNPQISPDGRHIAFISKRAGDEAPQVYVIAPFGGEARRVSQLPFPPSALKWSQDGKYLFFIAWTWPDTPTDADYRKRDQEQKNAKVKAYVIDDATYRYWDKWIADGKRPHVFRLDLATGTHRNLLTGTQRHLPPYEPSANDYDVSPDGKELCFVSENVKAIGLDTNHDLFALAIEPAEAGERTPRNLTADNPANDTNPVYSPDGKSLLYLRQKTKFFYADQTHLMRLDRATGKAEPALVDFDRSVTHPAFARDGALITFEAERDGYHRTYVTSTRGNLAGVAAALTNGFSHRAVSSSADGTKLVFLESSFNRPPTLMVQSLDDPKSQQAKPLGSFNQTIVDAWKFGPVEDRKLKGYKDAEIQTFILYPPNFDPAKKWPLLQMVHGGPHNAMTHDWSFRWNPQLWAAQGWVVAIVNFHGSSGFGQAFADSITGDYGTKPLADILATTAWFEQQPWIDKNRMAAAGASYGGYMMSYLNGHTDKFKAMVCHAGVYSYASQMASDIVISRQRALGGFPWDDYARMDKQSSNRFAQNFKTPTLVLHGEKDYRVPITQGLEYYNTLKMKGVPARLVYFPDENHWILKPQNSLLWHKEVFGWLTKYIGTGPS